MQPLRIACVRFLNTLPLIEGLERLAGVELIGTVPSRIGEMVACGEADVGLASLIDAATLAEPLAILPVGMIGCDGPTLTVRLFSDVPFERVERIHADSDSRTSIVLAQVLLARLHGVRPEVVRFDAREGVAEEGGGSADLWPETLLLIGDKVVTSHPPAGRYPHQMDLGEAWRELTGLPFVYAAWTCRASEADSPRIGEIASVLDRARRRNAMRLGWLAARRAPEHRWPTPLAHEYLTRLLRYEVNDRAREGVARFLEEASDLGLIGRATISWREPLTTCPA